MATLVCRVSLLLATTLAPPHCDLMLHCYYYSRVRGQFTATAVTHTSFITLLIVHPTRGRRVYERLEVSRLLRTDTFSHAACTRDFPWYQHLDAWRNLAPYFVSIMRVLVHQHTVI